MGLDVFSDILTAALKICEFTIAQIVIKLGNLGLWRGTREV
jgi:hypothetical protein